MNKGPNATSKNLSLSLTTSTSSSISSSPFLPKSTSLNSGVSLTPVTNSSNLSFNQNSTDKLSNSFSTAESGSSAVTLTLASPSTSSQNSQEKLFAGGLSLKTSKSTGTVSGKLRGRPPKKGTHLPNNSLNASGMLGSDSNSVVLPASTI